MNSFAFYDKAYENKPPKLPSRGLKISDEHPFRSNFKSEDRYVQRKKKLYVSSLRAKFTQDTPDSFTVDLPCKIKNIRYIRMVQVGVDYTPTASTIRNAFVYFPDINQADITSANDKYHGYFPIVQGTIGTPVLFNYNFDDVYITDLTNLDTVDNSLRVKVYREDASDGSLVPFTELDEFFVEIEFNYIDFVADRDFNALHK